MSEKIKLKLGDIQTTLLLPLWGRAVETQKTSPLLVDKTAFDIVNKIDYDFSTISRNITEISQIGWIVRSLLIDKSIRRFIKRHPKATIVNIGCGLDTTFERVDNGEIHWYDLDLPDVIELRRKFIQEDDRRKYISGSFLDNEWIKQLYIEDSILFTAVGVLYFFDEKQIRDFIINIANKFPGCEIVFDATSPIGIRMANKMVLKKSGMKTTSLLKWGLRKPKSMELWDTRIKLLEEILFFRNLNNRLKLKNKLFCLISDLLYIQYLVHLKIKQ